MFNFSLLLATMFDKDFIDISIYLFNLFVYLNTNQISTLQLIIKSINQLT